MGVGRLSGVGGWGEGLLVETCGAGVSAWVEGFGLGPKRLLFIPSSL